MLKHLFVLISSATYAAIIPVHLDEYNQWHVPNASILGNVTRNSTFRVEVTFLSSSYISTRLGFPEGLLLGDHFHLDRGALQRMIQHSWMTNRIQIGIGRGNIILDRYRSISVLKNDESRTGLLIIGDDEADSFNRSCIPGTVALIPYEFPLELIRTSSSRSVAAQFRLVFPSGYHSIDTTRDLVDVRCDRFSVHPQMLSLSSVLALELYRLIRASGAVASESYPARFSNCTYQSLISELPEIEISFSHGGSNLKFFPDGYIYFNRLTRECRMKFYVVEPHNCPPYFDPLSIPNVNLHMTNDEIRICDAL